MRIDKDKLTLIILRENEFAELERFFPFHQIKEIEIVADSNFWTLKFFLEMPRIVDKPQNEPYLRRGYAIRVGKFESYETAKEFLQQYFNCVNFAAPMTK